MGNGIRDGLRSNPVVQVGWQVPESQSCYWFLRMVFHAEAARVDKATFCKALAAEGIPATVAYRAIPAEYPWFRERKVFGNSGFPWTCSDYKGPREPQAHIANAIQAVETHFNIAMHESYGDQEVADIAEAVLKVSKAYAR